MELASSRWLSQPLHTLYEFLGWFAFVTWSASFHPQVFLNFRRQSVVGLDFDYLLLNFTKHTCYLVYNACMFFVPVVQRQYHEKYGASELIPVAVSDVAYSIHAVLLTAVTACQALVYKKGDQKLSRTVIVITGGTWFTAALAVVYAWSGGRWLWLISVFNFMQAAIALIKYIPQVWLNYQRKSTDGYSIENVFLDVSGGIAYIVQMGVQSFDQRSIRNFLGNNGKLLFSLIVLLYDGIFLLQHYVLYRQPKSALIIMDFNQTHVDNNDTHMENSRNNHILNGRFFFSTSERFPSLTEKFIFPYQNPTWDANAQSHS